MSIWLLTSAASENSSLTDMSPFWSCGGELSLFDGFFFWIDKLTVAHYRLDGRTSSAEEHCRM
jgi:hypothetical protein